MGIKNKRAIIMRGKCGEKEKSGLLVIDDLGGLEILVFRQMLTLHDTENLNVQSSSQ